MSNGESERVFSDISREWFTILCFIISTRAIICLHELFDAHHDRDWFGEFVELNQSDHGKAFATSFIQNLQRNQSCDLVTETQSRSSQSSFTNLGVLPGADIIVGFLIFLPGPFQFWSSASRTVDDLQHTVLPLWSELLVSSLWPIISALKNRNSSRML